MPPSVKNDNNLLRIWLERFIDSMNTYNNLVEMGVQKSDAIQVVPRGLKLGVIKTYNFYNLTTGYMSLRLCSTAEPEMNRITQAERKLFMESGLSQEVKDLISTKCHYTGFCHEEKSCGLVKSINPSYSQEFHSSFRKEREKNIEDAINGLNI